MADEKKHQGDGQGFAGLSAMVSDVDAAVASVPKQSKRSSSAGRPERQGQPRPNRQTSQAPAQPSGGSSAGKWLIGIAAVIGLIWLADQPDNSSSSRPPYSSGSSSTAVAPTPTSVKPQTPSRLAEERPSVGRNNALSIAQIRYCLAEEIRLDASGSLVNSYVQSDVNRFNGYVNDYNSRCSEFRYRRGALESARRDVEPYRNQLQAEGRSRFVRSPSAATRSQMPVQAGQSVRPSPDATVQAVQRRLNELGYNAGTVDGLFGNKTRVAILAFQRDSGYATDGVVTAELLRQLGRGN